MSAAPSSLTRVGDRYELLTRLGVGGMAELYVARSRAAHGFEKIVALKRILPHLVEDEDFARMFLAEARIAALLHHPNIAQVYDFGEDDGTYFFTMEYVLGQDLRRIVRTLRGRDAWLKLDHTIFIVAQIAAGLHYAHEKEDSDGQPLRIVHRDVSPSNILVSYDGGVKLVDFGIARAAIRSETTQTGVLKGKIPYMSPEQCLGEPLDRRSDVFSLGVVLWELACCRRLFVGDNDLKLVQRIGHEDAPPPTAFLPHFPADLERIIMRALARDRERRYASAQELQVDLEELARERKLALSSVSLGRLMSDLFADRIKEEKAALIDAKAGRQMRLTEGHAVVSEDPSGSDRAGPAGTRSQSLTAADPPPRPARRPLWIVLGLALVGAAVIVGWILAERSPAGAAAAAAVDAAAVDAAGTPRPRVDEAPPSPAPAPPPLAPADAAASAAESPADERAGSPDTAPPAALPADSTSAPVSKSKRPRAGKKSAKGSTAAPPADAARERPSSPAAGGDVPADLKDPFARP